MRSFTRSAPGIFLHSGRNTDEEIRKNKNQHNGLRKQPPPKAAETVTFPAGQRTRKQEHNK